jgi:serine/threonine protein kinase
VQFKQLFDTPTYAIIEMEYVQGGLLKKLFKRSKPLAEPEVVATVKNLLEGVGHIHEHGYMHRDLKPENILLCQGGGSSFDLKIVDFGLSVQHKCGPISLQEQIDDKVGTLVYMAPEQASYQTYSKVLHLFINISL